MSARDHPRQQQPTAQKWRDLAERRRQYIVELYEAGRWKHYYTETTLVAALREATQNVDRWDEILRANSKAEAQGPDAEAALQALQDLVREATEAPDSDAESDAA
jgi:uncharacterized repeat protein (TIGR03809 family)